MPQNMTPNAPRQFLNMYSRAAVATDVAMARSLRREAGRSPRKSMPTERTSRQVLQVQPDSATRRLPGAAHLILY